jgi:hypothetical protein
MADEVRVVSAKGIRDWLGLNTDEMATLFAVSRSLAGHYVNYTRTPIGRSFDIMTAFTSHIASRLTTLPVWEELATKYALSSSKIELVNSKIVIKERRIRKLKEALRKCEAERTNLLEGLYLLEQHQFPSEMDEHELAQRTFEHFYARQQRRAHAFPSLEIMELRAKIAGLEAEVAVWKNG